MHNALRHMEYGAGVAHNSLAHVSCEISEFDILSKSAEYSKIVRAVLTYEPTGLSIFLGDVFEPKSR